MNTNNAIDNLKDNSQQLSAAIKWLRRSYQHCQSIKFNQTLSEDEFDKLENLSSRFARTIDILINKMYRAIDRVEMVAQGTLIDTINNAEKRNLIDSVEQARTLKDIRNEIAHEYILEDLQPLFIEVLTQTKYLIELCNKALNYSQQYTFETNKV